MLGTSIQNIFACHVSDNCRSSLNRSSQFWPHSKFDAASFVMDRSPEDADKWVTTLKTPGA